MPTDTGIYTEKDSIKVSATLTHYRRLDHLERTLNSFFDTNTYPIDEFIIIDDSGDHYYSNKILERYSKDFKIIVNENNIGQRKSLDKLFRSCRNEYIFHLEEDWLFEKKSNYIEDSLKILEANRGIHQVHIRHEHDCPHPCIGSVLTEDGVNFRYMDPDFRSIWNGFSFNPGLRRKSDYDNFFPDGFSKFKDEADIAKYTRNFNYTAVRLENTVCKHIGWDVRTQLGGVGF